MGRSSPSPREERAWVYVSDLQWNLATTGWIGAAGDFLPHLNTGFNMRPISFKGRAFSKGLGVFPLSEIEYTLDRKYATFNAQIGINDGVPDGMGSVDFLVFLDNVLAYDSGTIRGDDQPKSINISVADATVLRLVVTDGGDGTDWDYASWGGARLQPREGGRVETLVADWKKSLETRFGGTMSRREREQSDIRAATALRMSELLKAFKLSDRLPSSSPEVRFDPSNSQLIMANNKIALFYGLGGKNHALLSVLNLETNTLMIQDTTGAFSAGEADWNNLHENTVETENESYSAEDFFDPGLGQGKRITITLAIKQDLSPVQVIFTLYDDKPYFTYQMAVQTAETAQIPSFRFFELKSPGKLLLGDNLSYISDYSQVRQGKLIDDSVIRKETIGLGKPIFIWSDEKDQGIIQAIIDTTEYPAYFAAKIDQGRLGANFALEHFDANICTSEGDVASSRRLFVELTDTSDTRFAFSNFKRVMASLYPAAEIPKWVKYQWLSWYVKYMDISEDELRRQVDYISDNLLDLGEWNILIDAGWYIAEGKEGSEWRNVNPEKFPYGLRNMVDYAHAKGLKVVLYFSSPYVDDRSYDGNWLGLKEIVDNHRDWLIPLREDETGASYVYDYSNPGFRDYLSRVLEDYFVTYDVDGLKLDGMGDAEGAIINQVYRGAFGQNQRSLTQAVQTYEFIHDTAFKLKKDIYIESGWLTPVFAHPFAHTFRYGDESPAFDNRYPFPGLEQHVDYAIIQQTMLGQRPNMGAIYGDPNDRTIGLSWLDAGLALGTQVAISLDFPEMTPEMLSEYRTRLLHYNAFQGETTYGDTLYSDTFQTTVNGYTYVGAINRLDSPQTIDVRLEQLGLKFDSQVIAYDVERKRFFRPGESISVDLEPDSLRLFILRAIPGIIWSNSSYSILAEGNNSLGLSLRGPAMLDGFAEIYVPPPTLVVLDGVELPRDNALDMVLEVSAAEAGTYMYDSENHILTLNYDYSTEHTVQIEW